MFYECNDLESIDLSSFDIINVSYMEHMFSEEEKTLKEIKVNKYSFDKFKKEFPYLIGVFKKIN
jgi:surface protein